MSEPIEHRSELDEAEEGDGKLLVTSRDPTVAFDAGKVVLNRVSMRIEAAVEAIGNATGAFWGDADHRAAFCKAMPETIRIESPVGNGPAAVQLGFERLAGPEVMLLSRSEMESDCPADTVDNSSELRIEASFGPSHSLGGLSANRIGTVSMHLDVRAVHSADSAKCRTSKLSKDSGPETRCTPSSEARVDRAPGSESVRKVSPRDTGAKHIPHRRNHASVILARSPSFVTRGHLPISGAVRSIFLAAPKAARATPSDL